LGKGIGKWIIALIIIVPLLEWYVFLQMIEWIGGWNTLILLLTTSLVGVLMMRFEGRKVIEDTKQQMDAGEPPGRRMLDGLCVFVGGVMLVLPGFILDIVGFTLVFPLTRPIYRNLLLRWIEKRMKKGSITIHRGGQ
jgi:UPF0716 protein FxsA